MRRPYRGPFGGELFGELADGGGLPAAIDAHDHDDVGGLLRQIQLGAAAPILQQRLQSALHKTVSVGGQ